MSVTIETEVTLTLSQIRDALEVDGFFICEDEEEMANYLRENGWNVFEDSADAHEILDDMGAYVTEAIDWTRNQWDDSEILEHLSPDSVAEFAQENDLVETGPKLEEISIADLMGEMARRLTACDDRNRELHTQLKEARELGLHWQAEAERLSEQPTVSVAEPVPAFPEEE